MNESDRLFHIENVSYDYPHNQILDSINITCFKKDFLLLIGPNGSGKTTLFKLILGFLKPTKGSIQLLGLKSEDIGYVPQNSHITLLPIKVVDVVASSFITSKSLFGWGYRHWKMKARQILEQLQLSSLSDQLFSELSAGQMQKILLARAIANPKKLLLLDEPMASIDQESKDFLHNTLLEVNKLSAIFIISHDMAFFSQHQGRVLYLAQQSIKEFASIQDMDQRFFHKGM